MQRIALHGFAATLTAFGLAACDSPTPVEVVAVATPSASTAALESRKHVVVFTNEDAPSDFEQRVAARGGRVERNFAGAGVAVVSGLSDVGAAEMASTSGVSSIERDIEIRPDPAEETADGEAEADFLAADPTTVEASAAPNENVPSAAKYYRRQWNLQAIGADVPWAATPSRLGSQKVKVYLLDTGVDYEHPDLEGRVDLSLSKSVAGPSAEETMASGNGKLPFLDFHSHGTSVASLIVSNARLVAGVTQLTTLVAVKVHDRFRSGPIAAYVEGIMYAADNGADVIHLSIPASFNKREHPGLVAAINRATGYAHGKGAVIVAAAGNSMPPVLPTDFDHDKDGFKFCNAVHVLCVSATAPTSAAGREGPWTNWDDAAPYSFYGRSTINVAGPGGGPIGTRTAATAVPLACSHWSHRFSDGLGRCGKGTVFWGNDPVWYSTGTSFGAAATSGLAALLVSVMGHGQPDQIRAVIENSADDLGQLGTDPYYGKGRINVARALEMLR